MVCYARSGIGVLLAVIAILIAFGGGAARFLDMTALAISLVAVIGTAVVAATVAFVAVRTIQHRRARAGGCVGCTFRCQHSMTGRLSLVRVIERQPSASGPVALPMPRVRMPEPAVTRDDRTAPRWPDRPVRATAVMIQDH
ncbi:MAG TPA: hypothetical protein VKU39_12115 [Streptosporangiaceae bacterium]|nr:hypothetical protein [Streptosporangiaceae bacterium]